MLVVTTNHWPTDPLSLYFKTSFESNENLCKEYMEADLKRDHADLWEKVDKFTASRAERIDKLFGSYSNRFQCILHNDSWASNMLFRLAIKFLIGYFYTSFMIFHDRSKSDDGNPTAVKLIDFQVSRLGNPGLDLTYFFYTCTTPAFRALHFQDCIKYYYSKLTERFMHLSLPMRSYPFEDFLQDLKDHHIFGYCFARIFVTVILLTNKLIRKQRTENF